MCVVLSPSNESSTAIGDSDARSTIVCASSGRNVPECDFVEVAVTSRRRLTKEGYRVLASLSTPITQYSHETDQSSSAFFDTVSRYPTAVQCKNLADVVRQLRSCEWCTENYVYRHMANRRKRVNKTQSRLHVQADPPKSLSPTYKFVSPEPAPGGSASSAMSTCREVEDDDAVDLAGMSVQTPLDVHTRSPEVDVTTPPPPDLQGSVAHTTDPSEPENASSELAQSTQLPYAQMYYAYPMFVFDPSSYTTPDASDQAGPVEHLTHHTWRPPLTPSHSFRPRAYHTGLPPLTPSPSFAATSSTIPATALRASSLHPTLQPSLLDWMLQPPPSHSTRQPPALPSFAPGDPRLHDLATQLEHALLHCSTTGLRPDLPNTLADLADRLASQQGNINDFLRALDGSAYTRVGNLPSDAPRMTYRSLDCCSVHGVSGACSQTMRGLAREFPAGPQASSF
ncbi:hypothetical protein K466DRAFT_621534 [Polyporus arcularius HHB13444]|uniref:Uncharacterized protein n=1 Tax=Polyporus arcularius HHB13444 TaxID=1314778 RepID=A0A5C3PBY1_9APHY|nr:hypothetical protein K466DRAFT_621534 [Polyporus arcularius HHB13444]